MFFPGRESVTNLSDDEVRTLLNDDYGGKKGGYLALTNIVGDDTKASFSLLVPNSNNKSSWVTSFGKDLSAAIQIPTF